MLPNNNDNFERSRTQEDLKFGLLKIWKINNLQYGHTYVFELEYRDALLTALKLIFSYIYY